MRKSETAARSVPCMGANKTLIPEPLVGVAAAVMHGRGIIAVGVLALGGAAPVQAQVGLASGAARITLVARVAPGASIVGVTPARSTAGPGGSRDETVGVRLSANSSYRLMVVGTAPASSPAEPARRLWVQAENGPFVEVRSGAAVTVARGRHAVAEEAKVVFRSETESIADSQVLPVRYEVRIDPTI